jgi:hypothetical protein
VIAFQRRTLTGRRSSKVSLLEPELEKQRLNLVQSFALAKDIYEEVHYGKNGSVHGGMGSVRALTRALTKTKSQEQLDMGAEFLQQNLALNNHQASPSLRVSAHFRAPQQT